MQLGKEKKTQTITKTATKTGPDLQPVINQQQTHATKKHLDQHQEAIVLDKFSSSVYRDHEEGLAA